MNLVKILAITTALAASGSALAGTETWDFDFDDMSDGGAGTVYVTSFSESSSSDSGNSGTVNVGAGALNVNSGSIINADMYTYNSGIRVINDYDSTASPDHSIDNTYTTTNRYGRVVHRTSQYKDFVTFDFNHSVTLSAIDMGWATSGKADFNIFVFNNEWVNLGAFADVGTSKFSLTSYAAIAGSSSTKWAIAAYTGYGEKLNSGNFGNTGFKLEGISVTRTTPDGRTQVPEPAALALVLGGLALLRRQSKK